MNALQQFICGWHAYRGTRRTSQRTPIMRIANRLHNDYWRRFLHLQCVARGHDWGKFSDPYFHYCNWCGHSPTLLESPRHLTTMESRLEEYKMVFIYRRKIKVTEN